MNKFKMWRLECGLSQKDVTESLGYSTIQFCSNWERDVSIPPYVAVKTLSKIFKVDQSEIIKVMDDWNLYQLKKRIANKKKRAGLK